jgi:DNA-binding response OmpR family regulator
MVLERESSGESPRILVADDNAEMRSFIRRLLAGGYVVDVVANGRAALAAAREERPDLLITDLVMPEMDGLELLKAIRADVDLATIPVIVLTERGEVDARIEGIEAGADDYLTKPFSPRELRARVRANLELAHMREAVERAAGREEALREEGRRKDEFLSMLAHELRNPLAPMGYGIHLLGLASTSPERQASAREMLNRQLNHLTRIVDDLLDVSRITSGKLSLARERLNVVNAVRTAVEDRRASLESAGLTLDVVLPSTPIWVEADPTRLAQLIDNILDNARKFTPAGGVVRVAVSRDDRTKDISVTIRDSGVGIDPGLLPRIFDAFAQATQPLDRTHGGLGLGLAVAKGLAELHGGSLAAESEGTGRGTQLTIRLPVVAELPALTSERHATVTDGSPLKVLIVEDNVDSVDILRSLLEYHGHQVSVAYDGPAGVQAAKAEQPDVVLCDIGLPGMDGYAVAGAIRQDPTNRSPRLIAVTGYGRDSDRDRALESGFDLHLVKPVNPTLLLGHLRAASSR